jgi:stearoyl-CoA desaturase (delta-9 desaturase)
MPKSQHAQEWNYTNLFWISLIHLLALAAIPFFTWSAFSLALAGIFVMAPLGINIGYHRLLTHKSFSAPSWFRYTLITLGTLCGAGPPVHWAAMHRVHHRFSDTDRDPHDSTRGFWYSHVLHLFFINDQEVDTALSTYAPDLLKEPYLLFLNRYGTLLALMLLAVIYAVGGWSWLLWGGFFRVAATWNIMWLVNSASHMWGYRNYQTNDRTVNCWWVGLLAAGEGWHNNHHALPSCAVHGHRWWEFDLSYLFLRCFELVGLVHDVKRPKAMEPESVQVLVTPS